MTTIAAGIVDPRTPGGRPASWAATGRSGGVSAAPYASLNLAGYVGDDEASVDANRRVLARTLGLDGDALAIMDAVHGADVAVVDRPGVVPGVDALITRQPLLGVVALGADCVPLAIVGDDGRTVAAVHCGWRGLVSDVVGATLRAMADLGCGVQHVALGASVCGRCYPVPAERAAQVADACPPTVSTAALVTCPDGQPGIDVGRGVRARLIDAGVPPSAIEAVDRCTVEDPGLFSYRRDGVTGRQGIAVARMGA